MQLIDSSFEIINQGSGIEGVKKIIELSGRTCYKSYDKMTDTSYNDFVDRMIANKHLAMLEHGTIYLYYESEYNIDTINFRNKYADNKYSIVFTEQEENIMKVYVTTNLRVIVENGYMDDLRYLCEPDSHHEKRVCVHFILDAGVGREFTRHRKFSFAQESTRYCNYSKNKFGNELIFIKPVWADSQLASSGYHSFINACMACEAEYMNMISDGLTAQEARDVIPLSIKSELVMTGFVSDWKHFFDLRAIGTTGAPHPAAKKLAQPLMDEFIKRELI